MDTASDLKLPSHEVPTPLKRRFWEKFGGASFTISVIFHLILLAIGLIIVFEAIPKSDGEVKFMPPSGGGHSSASSLTNQKHRVQMMQPNLSRVSAMGATSNFILPEPDEFSQISSMASLTSGSMAGGLGSNGSGNGSAGGPSIGSGMAPVLSDGNGSKNPFGMAGNRSGALIGTFYDLKQTNNRKPTNMTDEEMRNELPEIVKRGFKDSVFRKYYKAPRELYQTKLFIPSISADGAPAAFECQKDVQPRRWLVTYRGGVIAPKSGKFRFVGLCDDVMVIRFDNRPVFDYGYTIAGTGTAINGRTDEVNGNKKNVELANQIRRDTPMRVPISFYRYERTPMHNSYVGGMAVGAEFSVEAGKSYPIDILIGEIPGGSFSVALMIEEVGATYQKDPAGFPILPLFRLDQSPPSEELKGESPPYDPEGPVWKFAPNTNKREI